MGADSVERVYRQDYGRILASLIRVVRDFELAEDALADAFAAALEQWPRDGAPQNPPGWIAAVARNKAIDRIRRQGFLAERREEIQRRIELDMADSAEDSAGAVADERLRLIFTCCHPAIGREAQVALALRTLCGLTTDEVARAFLVPLATMAQRLVRARRKIRAAGIPYEVPAREALAPRLDSVLSVIYLVFTEGYSASAGDELIRRDLCSEAVRLARIVTTLMPDQPEPRALLALMLLQGSRREARLDANGGIILLEDQDRSRWNRAEIAEGLDLADAIAPRGFYAIQAAIAAEHARAMLPADTNWTRIAELYAALLAIWPNPVVDLNYAVAVAMAHGFERGLALIERIEASGELAQYQFMWSAKADLLRRLGRFAEAAAAYRRALKVVRSEPERGFLEMRLRQIER
jgi:RNA polymerase sigma-70 factor, ECF subfamily